MKLHLDGVEFLANACRQNNIESKDRFNVKRDLWLRVTAVVHTALALVVGVAAQLVRGVTFVITGTMRRDWKEVKFGLVDIPSALVQAVVLPVLGIAIAVTPTKGKQLLDSLQIKLDVIDEREEDDDLAQPIKYKVDQNVSNRALRALSHFVKSLPAVATAPVVCASHSLSALASFEWKSSFKAGFLSVALPLLVIPGVFIDFVKKDEGYVTVNVSFNLDS